VPKAGFVGQVLYVRRKAEGAEKFSGFFAASRGRQWSRSEEHNGNQKLNA